VSPESPSASAAAGLPPIPAGATAPAEFEQRWTAPVHRVPQILPGAAANAIALTIDDGPHPVYTPMVLEVLQRYGVKATFSMIGINVQRYPQVARAVVAAGHSICNHSMWHPIPFQGLTLAQVQEEVADGLNRIWDATRTAPAVFRAPGGGWSPAVYQTLSSYGLIPLDWDVDPRDWSVPGVAHIEQVLETGRGGDILLCHDGGGNRSETVQALAQVIPALLARKLEFVTI
jgi:peptidoglycan/xylan/chitin deacetylase (PgdA/CDA1 family)